MNSRTRPRGSHARAVAALDGLRCRHRTLLLSSGLPSETEPEELRALLGFVRPDLTVPHDETPAGLVAKLQPNVCRRLITEVARTVDATRELMVPVEMTPRQAQLYQTALARRFDVLSGASLSSAAVSAPLAPPAAGKTPAQRAAQLRVVYSDLRKVCSHPFLLPELEPERENPQSQPEPDHHDTLKAHGAAEAWRGASDPSVAVSGKLQALGRLMTCFGEQGKTVLLLSHTSKVWGQGGGAKGLNASAAY